MDILAKIAEQKIREAIEQGEFDHLENAGKTLDLDDDTWIPDDLRLSYRVLKNAGCIPPELELRNEIISLRCLLQTIDDDQDRTRKLREMNFKLMKLCELRKKPFLFEDFPEYEEKIWHRLLDRNNRHQR
jgi:hypothetical protein